jgi:putative ABC transport system permease protein
MGSLNQLEHVSRRLLRSPLFTTMTLATLAIGIGANTAIFSVIDGVLLKPLPYPHPEELVGVWHTAAGLNLKELNASPSLYFTYRQENRVFEDIGLWAEGTVSVTGLAEPEQVHSLVVTDGTLPLLRVRPILGRGFSHKDDSPGSPETVLLAYGYWQSKFGGNPSVIGRRIVVDGKAREVIGVLPRRFQFLNVKPSLIRPFQFDRNKVFLGNFSYQAVARLKPGVTLARANADVARMLPIANQRFQPPPGYSVKMFEDARIGPNLRPFKRDLVGDIASVLWVLMGTIGMVLLIACANVANLLLVRAEGRQQELAIRAALGAGSAQIARELLFESVTLGLLGGALGLGVAYGGLRLLVALAPANLPRLDEISIDSRVLLFTLLVSLLAGVLFGLIPVFKYAGPQLATSLRSGGRTASQSRERHRARNTLVVVQVALALVLLIVSGLMIRTFQAMRQVQPGFTNPEEIQTLSVSIPPAQVKEPERVARMQQDILDKIARVPGVSSTAILSIVPMDREGWSDPIYAEDRTYADGKIPPIRRFRFVSPGLFRTIGNRLVAGRDLAWSDSYNKTPVAVVSENLARELWHNPNAAIGKRIRESLKGTWRTVVGVVGDERDDGVNQPAPSIVYWPTLMKDFAGDTGGSLSGPRTVAFVIRSSRTGSEQFLAEIRRAVWSVNPNLPLAEVRTLAAIYKKSLARTSFTLVMLVIAGAMALLLGLVGIYGVISYSVSQRTREIGIRMAIGARQEELTRMFVRHGVLLAGVGIVCGLSAAIVLSRLISSLLFGVSATDPLTYCAVSIGLVAAAALASFVPARKVAAVDPLEALRAE